MASQADQRVLKCWSVWEHLLVVTSQWEYYDLFSIPASYYLCAAASISVLTGPNCFESNWHFMKQ